MDCLAAVCPEFEDDAEAANLPEWHVVWKWLVQAQTTGDFQHLPSDQTSQIWMSSGRSWWQVDVLESEDTRTFLQKYDICFF